MQAATGARCCFFTLQEGQDVGCTMCGAGVTEQGSSTLPSCTARKSESTFTFLTCRAIVATSNESRRCHTDFAVAQTPPIFFVKLRVCRSLLAANGRRSYFLRPPFQLSRTRIDIYLNVLFVALNYRRRGDEKDGRCERRAHCNAADELLDLRALKDEHGRLARAPQLAIAHLAARRWAGRER